MRRGRKIQGRRSHLASRNTRKKRNRIPKYQTNEPLFVDPGSSRLLSYQDSMREYKDYLRMQELRNDYQTELDTPWYSGQYDNMQNKRDQMVEKVPFYSDRFEVFNQHPEFTDAEFGVPFSVTDPAIINKIYNIPEEELDKNMSTPLFRYDKPSELEAMYQKEGYSLIPVSKKPVQRVIPKTKKGIYDLQKFLKEAGYNPGTLDAIWGPKTEAALDKALKAGVKGIPIARKGGPIPTYQINTPRDWKNYGWSPETLEMIEDMEKAAKRRKELAATGHEFRHADVPTISRSIHQPFSIPGRGVGTIPHKFRHRRSIPPFEKGGLVKYQTNDGLLKPKSNEPTDPDLGYTPWPGINREVLTNPSYQADYYRKFKDRSDRKIAKGKKGWEPTNKAHTDYLNLLDTEEGRARAASSLDIWDEQKQWLVDKMKTQAYRDRLALEGWEDPEAEAQRRIEAMGTVSTAILPQSYMSWSMGDQVKGQATDMYHPNVTLMDYHDTISGEEDRTPEQIDRGKRTIGTEEYAHMIDMHTPYGGGRTGLVQGFKLKPLTPFEGTMDSFYDSFNPEFNSTVEGLNEYLDDPEVLEYMKDPWERKAKMKSLQFELEKMGIMNYEDPYDEKTWPEKQKLIEKAIKDKELTAPSQIWWETTKPEARQKLLFETAMTPTRNNKVYAKKGGYLQKYQKGKKITPNVNTPMDLWMEQMEMWDAMDRYKDSPLSPYFSGKEDDLIKERIYPWKPIWENPTDFTYDNYKLGAYTGNPDIRSVYTSLYPGMGMNKYDNRRVREGMLTKPTITPYYIHGEFAEPNRLHTTWKMVDGVPTPISQEEVDTLLTPGKDKTITDITGQFQTGGSIPTYQTNTPMEQYLMKYPSRPATDTLDMNYEPSLQHIVDYPELYPDVPGEFKMTPNMRGINLQGDNEKRMQDLDRAFTEKMKIYYDKYGWYKAAPVWDAEEKAQWGDTPPVMLNPAYNNRYPAVLMRDGGKWIQGAVKRPGALTRKANKKGMTVPQYRSWAKKNKKNLSKRTMKQVYLADTFAGMKKRSGGSMPTYQSNEGGLYIGDEQAKDATDYYRWLDTVNTRNNARYYSNMMSNFPKDANDEIIFPRDSSFTPVLADLVRYMDFYEPEGKAGYGSLQHVGHPVTGGQWSLVHPDDVLPPLRIKSLNTKPMTNMEIQKEVRKGDMYWGYEDIWKPGDFPEPKRNLAPKEEQKWYKDTLDLQTKLKNLGYDPGKLDGVWGPKTKKAMEKAIKDGKIPIA